MSAMVLEAEIELLRDHMNRLGEKHGLLHPAVQNCSQKLDELLVRFYELRH